MCRKSIIFFHPSFLFKKDEKDFKRKVVHKVQELCGKKLFSLKFFDIENKIKNKKDLGDKEIVAFIFIDIPDLKIIKEKKFEVQNLFEESMIFFKSFEETKNLEFFESFR